MKKTFFHGTSADNLNSILNNGFNPYTDKIWNVSENGVYFWSPDKLAEYGECDEDYKNEYSLDQAYYSAQCALAKSKDCRAVVFEVEIDINEDDDLIEDTSCPNMQGAVVFYEGIPASCIKNVYVSQDLSLLKGCFIEMMMDRDLNNIEFSDIEKKVGEIFQRSDFIFDNSDFPLEKVEF